METENIDSNVHCDEFISPFRLGRTSSGVGVSSTERPTVYPSRSSTSQLIAAGILGAIGVRDLIETNGRPIKHDRPAKPCPNCGKTMTHGMRFCSAECCNEARMRSKKERA